MPAARKPSDSAGPTTPTGAPPPSSRSHDAYRDSTLSVFALLLALRIVNALSLRTFFQPDEFFQSLEPAWQLAFGQQSNAWITWEWRTQLRSSLHPEIFARVYQVAAKLADLCGLNLPQRAELLVATPKVTQAVFAAVLDCYTWKLAAKAYGRGTCTARIALALTVCSPWQWFCSTRTLSNCLETALTAIAVYHWPWHWPGSPRDRERRDRKHRDQIADQVGAGHLSELRLSLLLAALACILRPTNALIWLPVSLPTLWQASTRQRYVLVREILLCGSIILACSVVADRRYYQVWTLPPLRFLYFNIAQSLAVFYGRNRADYYLTEGLPLLLTAALPFALIGSWQAVFGKAPRTPPPTSGSKSPTGDEEDDVVSRRIVNRLAWTSLTVVLSLSLISHKEVRFLYPILPFLHVLSAKPLFLFVSTPSATRKAILILLLALNMIIAAYASQVHQRGVIDVLTYLRHKHEARLTHSNTDSGHNRSTDSMIPTTVGFLMPCHSTPWRSHLVHPHISAWALTCEPPLDIPISDRLSYLDEADRFYIEPGPAAWLDENMEDLRAVASGGSRSGRHWAAVDPMAKHEERRAWPQNLVFFAQLEPTMQKHLEGSGYRECWRGFNSHFHDDWRRVGDVVVWCFD